MDNVKDAAMKQNHYVKLMTKQQHSVHWNRNNQISDDIDSVDDAK